MHCARHGTRAHPLCNGVGGSVSGPVPTPAVSAPRRHGSHRNSSSLTSGAQRPLVCEWGLTFMRSNSRTLLLTFSAREQVDPTISKRDRESSSTRPSLGLLWQSNTTACAKQPRWCTVRRTAFHRPDAQGLRILVPRCSRRAHQPVAFISMREAETQSAHHHMRS